MKPRPRGHNLLLDPSTTSMLYFQRKWDEETSNDSYYYYLIMIRKNYIVFESVGKAKRSKFIFKNQGDCIWRLVYQPSIYDLTQFVSYQCARSFLLFTHLHLSHGIVCMYERRCDLPGFPLHCQCMDGPPIPHNTIFKLNLPHAPPPLSLSLSIQAAMQHMYLWKCGHSVASSSSVWGCLCMHNFTLRALLEGSPSLLPRPFKYQMLDHSSSSSSSSSPMRSRGNRTFPEMDVS